MRARAPWGAEPVGAVDITSTSLESQRIAGEQRIEPDADTIRALARKGKLVAPVRVCVSERGEVTYLHILKQSGAAEFDAKIEATIRTTWQFRPFLVHGKQIPACSTVVFIYAKPTAPKQGR